MPPLVQRDHGEAAQQYEGTGYPRHDRVLSEIGDQARYLGRTCQRHDSDDDEIRAEYTCEALRPVLDVKRSTHGTETSSNPRTSRLTPA
ncbi:hypothetical protein MSMEG_3938 [Mycolicibacterium smegmatis MC2 155]|uniref:Uncharacterized protein n=1 Tax=Mycolicibacterium smegmatis (strain ATCC 700084 / mc(2)155) TaxID=246196 RepID=A0QZ89_MYCS2|nr:hypothetical protein MSMEG_3938 [Mycolicibacterium smegmatis MC2 155]